MSADPLVSIIIDNYNYGRFLKDCIDSALNQTYPNKEVIVVDDGSTDGSIDVIARYGSQIVPIVKENGGQASAFNRGFAVSRGDVVVFLDSDDVLLPTAAAEATALFDNPDVVKVHWPLLVIDEFNNKTKKLRPGLHLAEGDLRETAYRLGPTQFVNSPTSGNAWSRAYLDSVFPVPEEIYRWGADTYLFEVAPFFGIVRKLNEPQTLYRVHSNNDRYATSLEIKLKRELRFWDHYSCFIHSYCRSIGVDVDLETWKKNSWWHRLELALTEIASLPNDKPLILVDDGAWEVGEIAGRQPIPFLERNGEYWGPPVDDKTAIDELERMRAAGAGHIAFVWGAFWWFDHYTRFKEYLHSRFECVLNNNRLVVFDLRNKGQDANH